MSEANTNNERSDETHDGNGHCYCQTFSCGVNCCKCRHIKAVPEQENRCPVSAEERAENVIRDIYPFDVVPGEWIKIVAKAIKQAEQEAYKRGAEMMREEAAKVCRAYCNACNVSGARHQDLDGVANHGICLKCRDYPAMIAEHIRALPVKGEKA